MEMLHEVSYNAFKAGAGITAAALAYVMDRYHPTLLVDETDNLDDEQRSEILAIANSGYKRGGPRVKMIPSGRGFELGSFETFGFKAFASVSYPAPALASRSIMLSMGQQQREVETTLTDESIEIGETIRAGLHAYMLRKKQVDMSEELRKKIAEAIQDGRVREMSLPLLMAAPEKAHEELWAYLEDLDKEHKSSEQTGWESDYIQALVRAEQKVENGKLSLREIQLALAEVQEADPMKTVTARTVSRNLKTLGFSVTRMSGGPIGIVYDNRLVENLKRRFLSGMFTSFTTFTSDADIPFTERASS
ncbi:MAG TPA: hypothetical protein VNA15_12270 [Candidatus Angelobacter sp.]|nr:hypothetical protein [Candidatus Angelobacter sp.]